MRKKEENIESKLNRAFIRSLSPYPLKLKGKIKYIYKYFNFIKDLVITINMNNNLNNIYAFLKVYYI